MAKLGRKPTYQSEDEMPVMVSVRVPRALEKQLRDYARIHRQSITDVVIDGIRMRLETPADPRDMILSDDNTVRQELKEMIRAEVQAEIGKLQTFMESARDALKLAPAPEASAEIIPVPGYEVRPEHSVVTEDVSAPKVAAEPGAELSYCSTTVLQEIEESKQATSSMPAPQPETPVPVVKTRPELSEDIVKIAEARRQYPDISERAFIQLLYDHGIYRHRAKDDSEVLLPHSTYRDWMKKAREAGLD